MGDVSVFFFDRPSRAALELAAEASCHGAVVVFEPSGRSDGRLLKEAISLAHVVKYADSRGADFCDFSDGRAAPVLEVHTLGERGLRYRHRLGRGRGVSEWMYQRAYPVPRVADACGAGDWCTAGLIAMTSGDGLKGLYRRGTEGIRAAMSYGQALAAWNCRFEGARGGMYAVDRESFDSQIDGLIRRGDLETIDSDGTESKSRQLVTCPSCSAESSSWDQADVVPTQRDTL